MNDQPEDPISALWAAWGVLWNRHGRPSPTKIARWSDKTPGVATLAESTIRGWTKPPHTTVPDWADGFQVLLRYIDSHTLDEARKGPREQDKPSWRDLWLKADDYRRARAAGNRSDPKKEEKPAEYTEPRTADPVEPTADNVTPSPADPVEPPANKPPQLPESTSGSPVEKVASTSISTKSWIARIKLWRVVGAAGILTVGVLAIVYGSIDRGATESTEDQQTGAPTATPTGSESTSSTPNPPGTRYCAYVTKEPAAVYPKPDPHVKEIKFKPLNSRVEVFPNREHPRGWIVVNTPKDPPGTNWMRSTVLSESAPCTTPLPGES